MSKFKNHIILILLAFIPLALFGQMKNIGNLKDQASNFYREGDFNNSAKIYKQISDSYQTVDVDSFDNYYFLYLKSLGRHGDTRFIKLLDKFLENDAKRPINPLIILKAMSEKGSYFTNKYKTEEAIKYNYKVLERYRKEKINDITLLSNILKQLSFNYLISGNADSSEHYSLLNLELAKANYDPGATEFGYAYFTLGNFYSDYENVEKADSFFNLALINLESNLAPNHPNLATLYYIYSNVRLDLGYFDEARDLCFKSIKIFEEKGMKINMAYAYTNLSLIESRSNNLENYKLYLNKIKEIYDEVEEYPSLAVANMNDGFSSYEISQNSNYSKAIEYQKKAMHERIAILGDDEYEMVRSYFNLATTYGRIDSLALVRYYLDKSMAIFNNEGVNNTLNFWNVSFEYAVLNQKLGNFTEAIEQMLKVTNGYAKLLGEDHLYVLEGYVAIFECYFSLNDLTNYRKYLYKSTDPYFGENIAEVKITFDILEAIKKRISLSFEEAKTRKDIVNVFDQVNQIGLGSSIQRSMITDRRDLIEYNKVLFSINQLLIDNALSAYKKYNDPFFVNKILEIDNEKRSNLIRSKIGEDNLLSLSKMTKSEKEKYKKLRSEARYLELVTGSDEAYQPKDLSERKIALKKNLNNWTVKNKDLFKSRDYQVSKNFNDLQKALTSSKTSLLSFDIVDGVYQCLLIKGKDIELISLDKVSTVDSLLNNFLALLKARENVSGIEASAHKLYQSILAPLGPLDEKLFIITTGNLKRLNFETLAYTNKNTTKNKEVDWLIHHHDIIYAVNIPELKSKKTNTNNNLLVLAPGFKKNDTTTNTNQLSSTPWTLAFCKKLAIDYNGLLLSENEATLANWERHKNGQSIIHIGTHAVIDDANPLNSKLLLDNEGNGINFFDIYKSELKSNLVVLAGCETGLGQLSETEEQLSLAHAFQYAGINNLIQSIWKIDDESTNIILDAFYKNYMTSNDVGQSLRLAKLTYISEASENFSSPYFWAGMVYVGNEIDYKPGNNTVKYAIGILLVFILVFINYNLFKKKK